MKKKGYVIFSTVNIKNTILYIIAIYFIVNILIVSFANPETKKGVYVFYTKNVEKSKKISKQCLKPSKNNILKKNFEEWLGPNVVITNIEAVGKYTIILYKDKNCKGKSTKITTKTIQDQDYYKKFKSIKIIS